MAEGTKRTRAPWRCKTVLQPACDAEGRDLRQLHHHGRAAPWQPWTADDLRLSGKWPATLFYFYGDQRICALVPWLNDLGQSLVNEFWNRGQLPRACRSLSRNRLQACQQWVLQHASQYVASVLEVIQDLGIEANITPSRRFDPLPDVSSAEVYKAAAGLEAAIAALKKLGHPTDELEKELTMLECRYKLWLVRARRRPERPFTRPTGGKRVILNLGLNVLYLYRVIVEGKALVGFRRPPRRPGQVYPCVLCEKDAPLVQHGPLPDKTVYREIANLLTLLQFRPEKESAVPGAPWTAAAVRRLVERYRSSEPLEIRS